MTCPTRGGTTTRDLLDLVDELGDAADQMLVWIRLHGPEHAAQWARKAGHLANRLIDLAEKGRAA